MTPLHRAAYKGHLSVVEYLVNQKADINAKDKDGKTPIQLANEYKHTNIADFLKKAEEEILKKRDCRI